MLPSQNSRPPFRSTPLEDRIGGGGGPSSTVLDYPRFLRTLLGGGVLDGTRILESNTVDTMFVNQNWIDRTNALCATRATQLLPVYDATATALLQRFEKAIYSSLDA